MGITVYVQPIYLSDQSKPSAGQYVWAYHVEIENGGETSVQLRDRFWEITNGNGKVEQVQGPGVVGEQPILNPGDRFEYTSGCPLSTPSGFMVGHYTMVREDGSVFEAEIPAFPLDTDDSRRVLN